MDCVNERQELLRSLSRNVSERLLQPVASTEDIVSQYINMLGVSHELKDLVDCTMVFTSIGSYLKTRTDGVKCLLEVLLGQNEDTSMMDDYEELGKLLSS